jgi:mevalonate kinase
METTRACAKIIMFGEHAVVYGKPGIAVPLKNLYTLATVVDEPFSYETDKEMNEEETIKMAKLFKLIFEKLDTTSNLSVQIESNIHRSTGLGSSASLSVALIKTFSNKLNLNLSHEKINEIAFECEKIFHGNPSGIDNTVITYEKPVFFRGGKFEFIPIRSPIHMIIANTGQRLPTKQVLEEVKKNYQENPEKYTKIFDEIGNIAEEAKNSLEKHDLKKTGKLMTRNHELLRELGVSNEQLDELVKRAIHSGAYGAKLAGAGKGGNVIALVDEKMKEKVLHSMKEISHDLFPSVIS